MTAGGGAGGGRKGADGAVPHGCAWCRGARWERTIQCDRETTPRLLVAILLCAVSARATAPSTLTPFELDDQHGVRGRVDSQTRLLVVTRDMDAGALAKKALAGIGQPDLDARGVVYVSEISRMPGLVSRLFALPAMRRRPYRILVDPDGAATRDVPSEAGAVAVLSLDALRIVAVEQLRTASAVRDALLRLPQR